MPHAPNRLPVGSFEVLPTSLFELRGTGRRSLRIWLLLFGFSMVACSIPARRTRKDIDFGRCFFFSNIQRSLLPLKQQTPRQTTATRNGVVVAQGERWRTQNQSVDPVAVEDASRRRTYETATHGEIVADLSPYPGDLYEGDPCEEHQTPVGVSVLLRDRDRAPEGDAARLPVVLADPVRQGHKDGHGGREPHENRDDRD